MSSWVVAEQYLSCIAAQFPRELSQKGAPLSTLLPLEGNSEGLAIVMV